MRLLLSLLISLISPLVLATSYETQFDLAFSDKAEFVDTYKSSQPSQQELSALQALPDGISVKIFYGTWCHDSQREVPLFYKTLGDSDIEMQIELIELDRDKKDVDGLAEQFNIRRTPTFVIFWQGKEVGRIKERPGIGLMQDINDMLPLERSWSNN